MIAKVISGGQAGADQAGLRAAKKAGIPTGGYIPWGYLTEEGYKPELGEEFGLVATEEHAYPPRTELNVQFANAVIWFGDTNSPGGKLTLRLAKTYNRHTFSFRGDYDAMKVGSGNVVTWLMRFGDPIVLMVAGNRESTSPGIGKHVEEFLDKVFRLLKEENVK